MEVRAWTQNLSVGFTEMDRQHMHLFAQIDDLANVAEDMTLALQALDRLGDAMFDHFAAEERYMAAMAYPELNSHRLAHRSFARLFSKVLMQVRSEPSAWSVREAHQALGDWMAAHISQADVPLGRFLAQNVQAQPVTW